MREKMRVQNAAKNLRRILAVILAAALIVTGAPLTSLAAEMPSEVTSEMPSDITPQTTPESSEEVTPQTTPESSEETTPQTTPESSEEAAPQTTPESSEEAAPQTTPESSEETKPQNEAPSQMPSSELENSSDTASEDQESENPSSAEKEDETTQSASDEPGGGIYEEETLSEELSIEEEITEEETETEEESSTEEELGAGEGFEIVGTTLNKYSGTATEVTIPDGIVTIGNGAFKYNKNITKVTFPESVRTIEESAFFKCSSLQEVKLNEGLEKIGIDAFQYVPFGKEKDDKGKPVYGTLEIPGTVIEIGSKAFQHCKYLKTVVFKEDTDSAQELTIYGDGIVGAFQDCENLEEVTLPDSLKVLPGSIFKDCTKLKKVTFGTQLTKIDDHAFYRSGLSELKLPAAVTEIGNCAFYQCKNLKTVELNNVLQTIGISAFEGATFGGTLNGKTVYGTLEIPGTVIKIEEKAFQHSEYLQKVTFKNGTAEVLTIDGGNTIGVFGESTHLEEVTLPDSLTVVPEDAFYKCKKLKNVTFGKQLTKIEREAFYGCSSLKSAELNSGLETIGDSAFEGAGFGGILNGKTVYGTLKIPGTVITIGEKAFKDGKYLKKVIFENGAAEVLTIGSAWTGSVFEECENLEEVTLPDSLTVVPEFAFYRCTALKNVTFGKQLKEIKRKAFEKCGLLELKFPATVTDIGEYAFTDCSSLKSVELNEGLKTIGVGAFKGAGFGGRLSTGATVYGTLMIPGTVITIGKEAFKESKYLKTAVFKNGTAQGLIMDSGWYEGAFYDCPELETVILPLRLETLKDRTFNWDKKLKELYIPNNNIVIEDDAIRECPKLTIYGKEGSTAETYAKKKGIPFSTANIFNNTLTVKFDNSKVTKEISQEVVSLAVSANGGVFNDNKEAIDFYKNILFALEDTDVKIKLTLKNPASDGKEYVIESVKIGNKVLTGAEVKGETAYTYDVLFTNRVANVIVKLKEKPKTVTIMKKAADTAGLADPVVTKIANKITQGTKQTASGSDEWVCTIENHPEKFIFKIKATDVSSKPIVKYGKSLEDIEHDSVVKDTAKPQTTEYTYTIFEKELAYEDTITIEQESNIKCTVKLENANLWKKVDVTVSQNGGIYTEPELKARTVGNKMEYEVLRGRELTIRADQRKNVKLNKLMYKIGTAANAAWKPVNARNGMAEIIFPDIRDDITITVDATGGYEQLLKNEDDADVAAVKGVYNVSYDGKYIASAKKSWKNNEAVEITGAKIFVNNAKVAKYEWTKGNPDDVFNSTEDKTGVNVDVGKVDAEDRKKKLTLKLYDEEDIAGAYTLQVYNPITYVKISNIQQMTDTQKEYALTTDGEKAKLKDTFDVTIGNRNIVKDALINAKGELVVTTGNSLGETTVGIEPKRGINAAGKTITVKMTKMLEKTKLAPNVTYVADDISLTLTMSLKNVPMPKAGEIYYEIKADAKKDNKRKTNVPANLLESRTVYLKRTGDLQQYRLIMQKLTGIEQPAKGKGGKCDYNVEVRLVYTNSKITSGLNADGSTKLNISVLTYDGTAEEIAGKEAKKVFSTIEPYYETKLQLTRGTTTVCTGQKNVLVATAKFDKKTTYTSIQSIAADDNLDAKFDATGKITVNPKENMTPGKYSIVVTAEADSAKDMIPSTAKIDVTVVQGIEELKIDIPTRSLYKAPKKTATIKPSITYNVGDSRKVPNTKKVEWSITDKNGNAFKEGDYFDRMLSINKTSGVVTVNKDFVLSQDDDKNKFTITASARDFQNFEADGTKTYNPKDGRSEVITITNKITEIKAIGLVKQKSGENATGYEIVALSTDNTTLKPEASKVHGAKLVAFKTAVNKDTAIANESTLNGMIIPAENLSFASNSKTKIAVGGNGGMTVIIPCKVTLTVNATDGSNQKKSMTADVAYDPAENLKLKAAQFTGMNEKGERQYGIAKDFTETSTGYTLTYPGGATLFKLTVAGAPAFANYEVKQGSGAKLLYKDGNDVYVAATAKDAKVTLQNKGASDNAEKKKVYTYTLTNGKWDNSDAPGVTQDSNRKLYAYGKKEELYAMLMPNAKALSKLSDSAKKLGAYVEIDWSKRTDKNEAALNVIAEKIALGELEIQTGEKGVKYIKLAANDNIEAGKPLIPGTYDLKVTFRKLNSDNTFTTLTKPVTARLTITAAKAVTFTPNGSFTIEKNKSDVQITHRTNAVTGELGTIAYDLFNANANGKSNEFTKYFKISEDKICLKEGVNRDIPKADLTGYIRYTVEIDKGYCTNERVTGEVKVTISVKQ